MTATRQERHKARTGHLANVTILQAKTGGDVLIERAGGLLELATELFGARAKGILSTAYMLPDPEDFLRRKVEEVRGDLPPAA